jgi:hypothetical protein
MDAADESLGHLRNDFIDEKQRAHESRAMIRQRLPSAGGEDQRPGNDGCQRLTLIAATQARERAEFFFPR